MRLRHSTKVLPLQPGSSRETSVNCSRDVMAARSLKGLPVAVLATLVILGTASPALAAKSAPDWDKKLEKGYHELQIGQTDKAIDIFGKHVKKYPESGACHTAYGRALKRKGRIQDAKEEFRKATTAEPTYADGFYELGVLCEGDREWKEAEAAFTKFVSLSPDASKRKAVEDRIRYCKGKQ